jgi:hypothetical protein
MLERIDAAALGWPGLFRSKTIYLCLDMFSSPCDSQASRGQVLAQAKGQVHKVSLLHPTDSSGELVCQDFFGWVYADAVRHWLFRYALRHTFKHRVDDEVVIVRGEQVAAKTRCFDLDVKLSAEFVRDIVHDELHQLKILARYREQIQVVGGSMPKVIARKRGATREKERVLAAKRRIQNALLKGR